jgi:threonine dehydratase
MPSSARGAGPSASSAQNLANTFAEGAATRVTFDLTFGILKEHLDDFVLLTEDELAEGVRLAPRTTHTLAEGAGSGLDTPR